ncbi:MAG: hypothetical protein K0U98_01950 [Deltaproteobacteria bacterium]|nr:hypothetical protein [Deltaproteobacteria bacterium]
MKRLQNNYLLGHIGLALLIGSSFFGTALSAATSLDQTSSAMTGEATDRFKIFLQAPGMYEVTFEDLQRAGLKESALPSRTLSLSHRGEEIPVWVQDGGDDLFGAGDAVRFAGEHLEGERSFLNEHSDTNVYWLSLTEQGEPVRFRTESSPPKKCKTPGVALASQRLERDSVRVRFSARTEGRQEIWFWQKLTQIDDAPFEQEFDLSDLLVEQRSQIEGSVPSPRLQIHLRGWSRLGRQVKDLGEDHAVEILWDDQPVKQLHWNNDPQGQLVTVEDLPAELLTPGSHRVGVRVIPRTLGESKDPEVDVVLFNWLELTYPRESRLAAGQHFLVPTGPEEGSCFDLSSESGAVEVFSTAGRQWSGKARGRTSGRKPASTRFLTAPGEQLWAVSGGSWLRPAGVVLDRPSNLRRTDHQADYLMIAHSELLEAAAPLADFHRQRGLNVTLVDVDDVYDEFNHGIVHPRALRGFVEHTYHQWQAPKPRYVLLVGDASWDANLGKSEEGEKREYADWTYQPQHQTRFGRNRSTPYASPASLGHRNLVPTSGYAHSQGDAASDNWFVAVDGDDDLPDLAIGRFPVTEPEEVAAIVAKTIGYMASPEPGDWRREVLWISDGTNLRDGTSDILAASLASRGLSARKVKPDRNSPTNEEHRDNLLGAFQEGQVLVHFTGHGGRYIWRTAPADFKKNLDLFNLADLDLLPEGGRLPVVVSMTCYSAPFDHPTADSIGEKFLRLPNRGAVAVIAASWRTSASRRLSSSIMDELTLPGSTVGEALRKAKQNSRQRDFIHMYNLLGDPALPLALPEDLLEVAIDGGEVPVLRASLDEAPALEGSVEWVDKAGDVLFSQEVSLEAGAPLVATYEGTMEALPEVLAARVYLEEPESGRSWAGGHTLEEVKVDLSNFSSPQDAFKKSKQKSQPVSQKDEEAIKAKANQQVEAAGEKKK